MDKEDLFNFFDRVVVINLERRPDRLITAFKEIEEKDWCFKKPEIFKAIDGSKVPTPQNWQQGGGSWACMQSHRHVLESAIMDDVKNILVLEDDICIRTSFYKEIVDFLLKIPDDWEQLMLGGQHMVNPKVVDKGVVKCFNCQRTHAYAIRGRFLKDLYSKWCDPSSRVHCDWIMGPMQKSYNVYAPDPFIFGQNESKSDINGRTNRQNFWTPPNYKEPILLLDCSKSVVDELRKHGVHTGYRRDSVTGVDIGLIKIFSGKEIKNSLKNWLNELMWEVTSVEGLILGVWHEKVKIDILQECWKGKIYLIKANNIKEALSLMPAWKSGAKRVLL